MFNRITDRVIDETTKFVDNAMAQEEGVIVQDLGTLQEVLVRAKEVRGEDDPSCLEIEASVIALQINGLERNGTEVGAIEAARRLAQEHKRGTAYCSAAQMEQFDRVLIRAVDEVGCDEEGNPSQEGAEQLRSLLESAQEMYGEADVRCFEIAAKRLLADADMAELVHGTYLLGGVCGGGDAHTYIFASSHLKIFTLTLHSIQLSLSSTILALSRCCHGVRCLFSA